MRRASVAKKTAYHHGHLPRALKRAALRLVAQHGVSGFTLREAARLAGVTHTAPYRHFPDKTALLAAVAADGFRELAERLNTSAARKPNDQLAALLEMGRAYIEFASEEPTYFRLMWGPEAPAKEDYPDLAAADDAAFQVLVERIRRAQAAEAVMEGDPRELAWSAWVVVHGFASALVGGDLKRRGLDIDDAKATLTRAANVFVRGVRRR